MIQKDYVCFINMYSVSVIVRLLENNLSRVHIPQSKKQASQPNTLPFSCSYICPVLLQNQMTLTHRVCFHKWQVTAKEGSRYVGQKLTGGYRNCHLAAVTQREFREHDCIFSSYGLLSEQLLALDGLAYFEKLKTSMSLFTHGTSVALKVRRAKYQIGTGLIYEQKM